MNLPKYLVTLLATLLFVLLFFEKSLGLNVAIYGVATTVLLVSLKTSLFQGHIAKVVGVGFLLTSILYFLFASPFTLFVHILSFVLLIGLHASTAFRSLWYAFANFLPIMAVPCPTFLARSNLEKRERATSHWARWHAWHFCHCLSFCYFSPCIVWGVVIFLMP